MRIANLVWNLLLIVTLLLFTISCSSNGTAPVSPENGTSNLDTRNIADSLMADGRVLWGVWEVGIDPVAGSAEVLPQHSADPHYDVTPFIMPPVCNDCFKPQFKGMVGQYTYRIDITLKNPTKLTAHDVRATVFNKGVLELRNPDSYTLVLTQPGETDPKPFKAYKTGPNRAFEPSTSHKETFHIYNLFHPDYSTVVFVIDASWPGNCKEPYEVANCYATGAFSNEVANTQTISCDVLDWQDDVQSVMIDLSSLGGGSHTPMTNVSGTKWAVQDVSWQAGGKAPGRYKALITALTQGTMLHKETFNYVELTVSSIAGGGDFVPVVTNVPLTGSHAPAGCLDFAVIGDDYGESRTLVTGSEWGFHEWNTDYTSSKTHKIASTIFDSVLRIDSASLATPEVTGSWVFGEVNDDKDIYQPSGPSPLDSPIGLFYWIYWWAETDPDHPGLEFHWSGWIIADNPDGEPPVECYTRPFDTCGGFNRDEIIYWGVVFDSGNEALHPVVGVHGLFAPYDDFNSYGFGGLAPQGSGEGKVNRLAVNGLDVDDHLGMEEVYVVFTEGSPENCVEIFQQNFPMAQLSGNYTMKAYKTITMENEPLDVEIFPATGLGFPTNWVCVLTSANEVEVYRISDGSLVTVFGGPPNIDGTARFIDVDDLNFKVHVMQEGPQVSVFKFEAG